MSFFWRLFGKSDHGSKVLNFVADYLVTVRAAAVDSDEIPAGYGEFGFAKTNPIPCQSLDGATAYLDALRTNDGKLGSSVSYSRVGSTECPEVTPGGIDMYSISADGLARCTLFISPYHKFNSRRLPAGFSNFPLTRDAIGMSALGRVPDGVVKSVCSSCGSIVDVLTVKYLVCPVCGVQGKRQPDNRFGFGLVAFSNKLWTPQQMIQISDSIKRTGLPPPFASRLHDAYMADIRSYKFERPLFEKPHNTLKPQNRQ